MSTLAATIPHSHFAGVCAQHFGRRYAEYLPG